MIKKIVLNTMLACAAVLIVAAPQTTKASISFDDFNVSEGHFTANPIGGSGSSANIGTGSAADRVTTDGPVEGSGHQKLVINATTPGGAIRLRHLSGGGSPANNVAFTTTTNVDGWIGLAIKADATNDPNWNVQIWLEGAPSGNNNGSVPKTIITDGQWHIYEWNLDDDTGGTDGWGSIASIATGSAVVPNISHTIDSVIFRNAGGPASSTMFMDFVAKTDSGSVSNLLTAPCLATSGVAVNGPLSTNSNQVTVVGVDAAATQLKVYQNGIGIGVKTTGIVAGTNLVTVTGLVKGAQVSATQTKAGQESCVPPSGIFVGGGANPPVRLAVSIRETTDVGPVGASAVDLSSGNIHFLGGSTLNGGPVNAPIISPSNQWQTVSFSRGTFQTIGDSANAVGTIADGTGYLPGETAQIQVYAYRTLTNGPRIYSATLAESSIVSSNDLFKVNWTWDAVPGAQGYRLLRTTNSLGYFDHHDVTGATNYSDNNSGWTTGVAVTPSTARSEPSVKWNATTGDPAPIGTQNNIPGAWGILESINFVINSDTGPFDAYIDNLQNGTTVFQTFETVAAGTTGFGFQPPEFSGTTSPGLLTSPLMGVVTNNAADTGTNSFRVQFQWNSTNISKWLRLTTSAAGTARNPLVNLDDPISFRLLLLPVGASLPSTGAPTITYNLSGNQLTLSWTGTFNLESKTNLSEASWSPVVTAATNYVTTVAGSAKFYRLNNP